VNICIHDVSRLFGGDVLKNSPPKLVRSPLGLGLPWVEAILGVILLPGLFLRLALVGGSLLILALTFGSVLLQDWDAVGFQLLCAAIYAALSAFQERDSLSLDSL
jgi:thiosulfate dehydrogenase [quinone] large subunit